MRQQKSQAEARARCHQALRADGMHQEGMAFWWKTLEPSELIPSELWSASGGVSEPFYNSDTPKE